MPGFPCRLFRLPRPRHHHGYRAAAWTLLGSGAVSLGLLAWMLVRWRQVARDIRQAAPAPEPLNELLDQARHSLGLRRPVRLRLTERPMSPAVCGLFRPVILLPRSLAEQLPPSQLRAVLLHELIHLRRGDVWVNCAQALLQLLYWWHPLLWLANARIRQVREEAVDDGVMLALREDAETYAPTLLEVARLALRRPLTSLGLVGILESRSSLRQRIQRLLDFHPPRKAGLTLASALTVAPLPLWPCRWARPPRRLRPTNRKQQQFRPTAPSATTLPPPPWRSKRSKPASLVQDARLLYEMGKLDEAKARLKQALALDPGNQAAWYYSNLIAEAPRNCRGPASATQATRLRSATSAGRRAILKKLNSIRLDHVSFEASTLGEALRILSEEARKRDPEKTGVNFILNSSVADLASVPLTLKPAFTEARLVDVLDALVKSAEKPVKYTVEDYSVVFSSRLR